MIRSLPIYAIAAAVLSQPAYADHHMAAEKAVQDAMPPHAEVIGIDGETIGTVVLAQLPDGVLISAQISGLPEGEHGFHIHGKGVCDPAEGFTTAGGHFAPRGNDHGLKEASGPHAGDMPNQFVGADGILRAHVYNQQISLLPGVATLNDADGSALMVHAGADDYTSQPSGAAGKRLACAVLAPPKGE